MPKKKQKRLFKATVPELSDYIGKTVKIEGRKIKIESIVGNIGLTLGRKVEDRKPQFYEINGKYLMSMLRFHAQMEGDTSITEDEFKAFEEMQFYSEKMDNTDPLDDKVKVKVDPEAIKRGEFKILE